MDVFTPIVATTEKSAERRDLCVCVREREMYCVCVCVCVFERDVQWGSDEQWGSEK